MTVVVVLAPGQDGLVLAGVASDQETAWDIVRGLMDRRPDLAPSDCPIFQTPLDRPVLWNPVAPMPPGWAVRRGRVDNRHVDPAWEWLPQGWWW